MNFREWFKINEMPLSYYGHQFKSDNDPDEKYDSKSGIQLISKKDPKYPRGYKLQQIGDKFSRRDKIIISHPKTARVLEEKLKKSKFNFNILFVELDPNWKKSQPDVWDKTFTEPLDTSHSFWKEDVEKYIKLNKIPIADHITFVKNTSTGHILTPWMILHNIGHALSETIGRDFDTEMDRALRKITMALKKYEISPEARNQNFISPTYGLVAGGYISPAVVVFNFKSVKDENIIDTEELRHELVAEYLWNGSIRPNPIWLNAENVIREIKDLGLVIESMLQRCVGQIIYYDSIRVSV